uniref:Leucine-rich repeat-containing protein 7 n=1 Tax=Hydra vulgaris TaxID=6087 RepID=T2M791_HYDVU
MPFKFLFCGKAEKETNNVLDYSHKNLMNVPVDIYNHVHTLEELYLDANQLKELPKALFTLQHLKLLNISDNEIVVLPSNISNLSHLLELDISKNGFLELPDDIKGMKSLQSFDCSVNPVGRMPDGFTMLLNLTHVYLNDCFLDFLPANIGRMIKLEVLEVRDNHLTMIPKSINRLKDLRRFDLGHNEFCELPEVIGTLTNLKELWLDGNEIKCLPSEIGNLINLEYLDASENKLEWICNEIEGCEMLTDLYLTANNLVQLPESLCKLKMLEILKVDENQLTHLPTSIGGLSSLRELICNRNQLETMPPGIGLLRKLHTLNVDDNFIEYLPDEIGSCIGLTIVSLRQNRLVHIPDDFGRLANLVVLMISSNMIEYLPYSMMKLKKLQALWLSENQAKPLIPLQTDWDPINERRFLTCYMFPQRPINDGDIFEENEPDNEQSNFQPTYHEEEWKKRTSVLFDIDEEDPQVVRLSRQPTPFPKDIKDRVNQFRQHAIAKGHVTEHHSNGEMVFSEGETDKDYNIRSEHIMRLLETETVNSSSKTGEEDEEEQLLDQLQNTSLTRPNSQSIQRLTSNSSSSSYKLPSLGCYSDDDLDSSVKPNIKLSSDSGLGSMQLIEESNLWRNEYPTIHEVEDIIRVTIKKTPNLGFSVSGGINSPGNPFRPDDMGIFITKILSDGPAASLLQPGDKVLEVNDIDFTNIHHNDAVDVLKSCDVVYMTLSRRHYDQT